MKQTHRALWRRAVIGLLTCAFAVVGSLTDSRAAQAAGPATGPVSARVPRSFVLTGSGFGHGIGMSQYGAYQMARSGKSASQILSRYYKGARVAYKRVTGNTRVQVYADSAKVDVFIANGRSRLAGATKTKAARSTYPDNTTFRLTAKAGKIEIRRGKTLLGKLAKGKRLYLAWENTRYFKGSGTVTASLRKAGTKRDASHGTYRYGRFEIMNIGGRVNIVNVLKTNTEYLYGLGEMPSYWGKYKGGAALQAQAIAARNYTLISSSYKKGCDCNLYDDVRSQYFSGFRKETAEGGLYWKTAVKHTVSGSYGKVMLVKGKPVQAFYYSSSGGATLNNENVWGGNSVSYLRSVKDPYALKAPGNPNVRWKVRVSQAKVKKLFPTLRNVVKLQVTARYKGGAVKTLRATDSRGKRASYTATSDKIRFGLGLKSAWIKSIARG